MYIILIVHAHTYSDVEAVEAVEVRAHALKELVKVCVKVDSYPTFSVL